MTLVIDASVACKWFIAEAHSEQAERLLVHPSARIAPDLIVAEVCNAAWSLLRRREITTDQAAAMVGGLPDLLHELVPCSLLRASALTIAHAADHPAYDCFYVALAEIRGARLVTADRKLRTKLRSTRWSGLLVGVDEAV